MPAVLLRTNSVPSASVGAVFCLPFRKLKLRESCAVESRNEMESGVLSVCLDAQRMDVVSSATPPTHTLVLDAFCEVSTAVSEECPACFRL
jgi:hypothetical protein